MGSFNPHKGLIKHIYGALSDFILILTIVLASVHFTDVGDVARGSLAKNA